MVKNPLLVRVRDMMRKRALLAGSNNLGDTMVPLGGVIMLALIGTAILLGLLSAQIERNADAYLHRGGKPVTDGFSYSSDSNPEKLDARGLQTLLAMAHA